MKYIFYIINSIFVLLMLAVAGLFLVPLLPIEHNLELKIVESGSMEPAIMTGSLVAIWPATHYGVGDIITFKSKSSEVPTTHRIANIYEENGQTWFITKGDANEEADSQATAATDVIGSVKVAVPYAGFILDFARQPIGFAFLILLPALMLILSEVGKIWSEIKKRKNTEAASSAEVETKSVVAEKVEPKLASNSTARPMMDISTPTRFYVLPTLDLRGLTPYPRSQSLALNQKPPSRWFILPGVFLFCATVIGSGFLGSTVSYFNDIERSVGNGLRAISLDFTVLPDGEQYSFENGELLADDDGALVTVVTPEPGSVSMRYDVSVEVTGGNALFCDAISASSVSPVLYSGSLSALNANDILFDTPWPLALSLPDSTGFFNGEMCSLDIIFTAWHYDVATDQGYFDEERAPLSFELILPNVAPQQLLITSFDVATDTPTSTPETKASSTIALPPVLDEVDNASRTENKLAGVETEAVLEPEVTQSDEETEKTPVTESEVESTDDVHVVEDDVQPEIVE